MTVMLDRFFGVHPEIVRSGVLKDMSEGEIRLYLALMERSEYRCNRELTLTDEELRELVGVAPRTSCNARKSLQERRLIQCKSSLTFHLRSMSRSMSTFHVNACQCINACHQCMSSMQ